ncbi:MAG: glycosyltransferase family 4 protein [Anaerolineales bacterium]|nr:glycosyltransferase family 4 protein [Anaerolineales bacterium]
MKIAVIAPTEIPARRANTLQVMKMTQALASLGHSVRLAAPTTRFTETRTIANNWEELARHYGLQRSFPIDWLPSHPRLRRYDFGLRAILWARRWGAELLYTRLPQAAASASLLGMKTIFEIHDLPQGSLGPWLLRGFLKGRGAQRLVVITQALATDLSRRFAAPGSTPFTVIAPDGVDLERYENLPSTRQARAELEQETHPALSMQLGPQHFVAGYTGHLYPGRGTTQLLELAARLPDIIFLIAGGEPHDVNRLRDQAKNRELENVILTGFVPNAELPRLQAACDVLLMPYQQRVAASSGGDISRYLSPMKLFEYLACERAILSSDLPVLREALNSSNAILLPADDLDAWVDALRNLHTNPDYGAALARQARLDAERYTWKSRAARILEGLEARPESHT